MTAEYVSNLEYGKIVRKAGQERRARIKILALKHKWRTEGSALTLQEKLAALKALEPKE